MVSISSRSRGDELIACRDQTFESVLFTDDFPRLLDLEKRIRRALKDEILLTPHVKLVPKGSLPVSEGKAVRVVDKRKVYQ